MATSDRSAKTLAKHMLCGGIAGSVGEICTIPLDTAKVRLQIQGNTAESLGAKKYRGMIGTVTTIAREEGFLALFNGLNAGLQRQMVFASLRIGLFEPVLKFYCPNLKEGESPSLFKKILAGITTGAFGISVANPTDVVKIRMQAQSRSPDGIKRYNGTFDCYSKIVKQEGVKGLWTGYVPNIMRNSIINAAELASFYQMKQVVLGNGWLKDGLALHFLCGFGAGFVAVLVGSPVDVIKTRMMNKTVVYKNAFDAIWKTFRNEGPLAFYNGFQANFGRIVSWNIVMFMALEQLKHHFINPKKHD